MKVAQGSTAHGGTSDKALRHKPSRDGQSATSSSTATMHRQRGARDLVHSNASQQAAGSGRIWHGSGLLTYNDPFSLISGFGDRFSAWLALFTLAHLRGERVLLTARLWANKTVSKEKQQVADIQQALDCLLLPPWVVREEIDPRGQAAVQLNLQTLFGAHKALPRPTPGFPQWAIPTLAYQAFRVASLLPSSISTADFIAAYREVSALISVAPHCQPRLGQSDAVALTVTPRHNEMQQRPGAEQATMPALSSEALASAPAGPSLTGSRQLLICVHLRRSDAWDNRIVHGKGRIPIFSAEEREKHTRLFRASLLRIAKLLLAATTVNTSSVAAAPPRHITWLILSDSANASVEVAQLLRSLPAKVDTSAGVASPLTLASSAGSFPEVPWRVVTAPPGYMVWSFLTMRHASGLIQSTLRTWSSFSAVPALMGDVPLFSIEGGDSFKSRAVPYDQGLLSQYTALKAEAAAFVGRVLQAPRPRPAGPDAAHDGRDSSLVNLGELGASRHTAVLASMARATATAPHRTLRPLHSQLRLGNGSQGLTSAHAQALVSQQAAVPAFANSSFQTLEEVYWTNERFRAQVAASFAAGGTGWLDPRQLNTSVFNYGLTRNPLAYVVRTAKPVGAKPIEHDLLTYLASRVHASTGRLDYLEIGVSVLKSFDTQVHYHSNASFTALDVEEPNWMRAARWGQASSAQSRPSSGIRKTKGRTLDHLYEWRHVPAPP